MTTKISPAEERAWQQIREMAQRAEREQQQKQLEAERERWEQTQPAKRYRESGWSAPCPHLRWTIKDGMEIGKVRCETCFASVSLVDALNELRNWVTDAMNMVQGRLNEPIKRTPPPPPDPSLASQRMLDEDDEEPA